MDNSTVALLHVLTESLITTGKEYENLDRKDVGVLMRKQLDIMAKAALLDKATNSQLGTMMWSEFELGRHSNWQEKIWKMSKDYETQLASGNINQ